MEKYYVIYEGKTLIHFGRGGEVYVPETISIEYFDTEYQAREFISENGLKRDF